MTLHNLSFSSTLQHQSTTLLLVQTFSSAPCLRTSSVTVPSSSSETYFHATESKRQSYLYSTVHTLKENFLRSKEKVSLWCCSTKLVRKRRSTRAVFVLGDVLSTQRLIMLHIFPLLQETTAVSQFCSHSYQGSSRQGSKQHVTYIQSTAMKT